MDWHTKLLDTSFCVAAFWVRDDRNTDQVITAFQMQEQRVQVSRVGTDNIQVRGK